MKKSKIVALAAIASMIGLTGAAFGTATFAWFTASNTVLASNMSIQAQAEEGILISPELATKVWKTSATATHTTAGSVSFIPTSTANTTAWYHANSAEETAHHSAGITIDAVTVSEPTLNTGSGIGVASAPSNIAGKNIYLLNHFYIKGSGNALAGQYLYLKTLTATVDGGSVQSAELDKSLRIAFYCDDEVSIFAPFATETKTYTVNDATPVTLGTAADETGTAIASNIVIPSVNLKAVNNTDALDPIDVKTFLYFEGEDANCKTSNIKPTLDRLNISFELKNRSHA